MKRIPFVVLLVVAMVVLAGFVHDFHVSYGRMVVEGNQAYVKIRMFKDDLENTLRRDADHPAFKIGPTKEADSLFVRYLNRHFVITNDGKKLIPSILQSGEEEDMWWYVVSYEAEAPIRKMDVRYTLFFDTFNDQRNIFKVLQTPGDRQQTFYYTRGVEHYLIEF